MTDCDALEANVRYLEAQLRLARKTLRDEFAMATLQGMLAGRPEGSLPVSVWVDVAYQAADAALIRRDQLPTVPDLNPVSQPTER